MNSETELFNKALRLLGQSRLLSTTDNSPVASACNDCYPSDRDAVLRAHPWNCAIARESLSMLSDEAVEVGTEGVTVWQLPADCLRVLDVEADCDLWRVEGDTIVCDATSVAIRYVRRIENVNEFDALLVEAVATKLASSIAIAVTGDSQKVSQMTQLHQMAMNEARYIDAVERRRDSHAANTYRNARG